MQRLANIRKESPWLTIGQAADHLGVSRDTLRRWEKAGKIKTARSPTNRRYYTQEQLDQLIGKQTGVKKTGEPLKLAAFALAAFIIAVVLALIILFFLSY